MYVQGRYKKAKYLCFIQHIAVFIDYKQIKMIDKRLLQR